MTKLRHLLPAVFLSLRVAHAQPSEPVPPDAPAPPAEPTPPDAAAAPDRPAAPDAPAPESEPAGSDEDEQGQITGADSDEGVSEQSNKYREGVHYKPGKGLSLGSNGTQMRLKFIVEPLLRFAYIHCATGVTCADPQTIFTIRRARLGFDTKLPHDLEVNIEVQVKNLLFGLTHLYGAWHPDKHLEVAVGFIKGPGNLERKVATWTLPFIERGVVSDWLTRDREMGVMLTGTSADSTILWQAAVGKPVAKGLDGAEAEDRPPPRPGALDPDDTLLGAGQINLDGRLEWDPDKHYELGVTAGVRFRDDGDAGDNLAEPYDTSIADAHQYTGIMVRGSIDAGIRGKHWRLIAEVGARRDGKSAELNSDMTPSTGNNYGYVGQVTFGWAPHGKYGAVKDYAKLKKGWEWVSRVQGAWNHQPGNEPAGESGIARFLGIDTGVTFDVYKQLRLQVDASYQWFGKNDFPTSAGGQRIWAEVWSIWRL